MSAQSYPSSGSPSHWEEVTSPDAAIGVTAADIAGRYDGTFTVEGCDPYYDYSSGRMSTSKSIPWAGQQITLSPSEEVNSSGGLLFMETKGRMRSIFRWVRGDFNAPPPEYLYLRVVARASVQASSDVDQSRMRGEKAEASANGVTGVPRDQAEPYYYNQNPGPVWRFSNTDTSKPIRVPTGGLDVVTTPWIDVSATGILPGERFLVTQESEGTRKSPLRGVVRVSGGYGSELVTFSISASPWKGALVTPGSNSPEVQELNAYLKQDARLNAPDQPLVPFWNGVGQYWVTAKDKSGHDLFQGQKYIWSVEGEGQPYIPAPETEDLLGKYLPDSLDLDGKVPPSKEFHLDFGTGNVGFPKDSTIRAIVTGEGTDTSALPAKAIVHWNLPRWFVTKPAPETGGTVTTVTGEHDPDKPEGPVDPDNNPDDPAYAAMQNIAAYNQAQSDVIQTGATLVAEAMQLYGEVAAIPFYELGGAALASAVQRVADLSKAALEARRVANEAAQVAVATKRVAEGGKAAGKSAEEVAKLERTAAEADLQYAFESKTASEMEALVVKSNNKVETLNTNLTENNLTHWFRGTQHPHPNMEALAQSCGSEEAAVREVLKALGDLPNGPIGGSYETGMPLTINGINITVFGKVENGVIQIGTMF